MIIGSDLQGRLSFFPCEDIFWKNHRQRKISCGWAVHYYAELFPTCVLIVCLIWETPEIFQCSIDLLILKKDTKRNVESKVSEFIKAKVIRD